MDLDELTTLHSYNRWANARTLDAVSQLTPDQLKQPLGGSFGTVLATLTHMLGAEWVWLERFGGRSPRAFDIADGLTGVGDLRDAWLAVAGGYETFIASLSPTSLAADVSYANFKGDRFAQPLGPLMQHVVNHATYHRGQVTFMLRLLGADAVATDFAMFLRERQASDASGSEGRRG